LIVDVAEDRIDGEIEIGSGHEIKEMLLRE
jgi:hypothetical protein